MKILITGAAGFVGVNLSHYLINRGHEVIGIDIEDRHSRLSTSHLLNNDRYTFRRLDLVKQSINTSELYDIDIIYHLAALPHVDYSYFYPHRTITNNIESLLTIIEFACRIGKPLIFSSSVEVYGGSDKKIYVESDTLAPLSPYAASKVANEAIIKSYVETQGLQATIFRFTNLYGRWQAPDRLLPRVISQILLGEEVTVEKGTNRDFVSIEDACGVLEKSAGFNHLGEVFNLSSGVQCDNYHAVEEILNIIPASSVNVIEPRTHDGRGKFLVSSPEKLSRKTGWTAKTDLKSGIFNVIEWYQSNHDWVKQFEENITSSRETDHFLTDSKLKLSYW